MVKLDIEKKHIILPKEALFVPYSNEVDYSIFSRVLSEDKMASTYKMYWLLAILDEVSICNTEIIFRKLISKMMIY